MKQPIQGAINGPLYELFLLDEGRLSDSSILRFGVASLILFFLIALFSDKIQCRVDINLMQCHPIPTSLLVLVSMIGMLQSILQDGGKFIVVPGSKLRLKLVLQVGANESEVSIELSLSYMSQLCVMQQCARH